MIKHFDLLTKFSEKTVYDIDVDKTKFPGIHKDLEKYNSISEEEIMRGFAWLELGPIIKNYTEQLKKPHKINFINSKAEKQSEEIKKLELEFWNATRDYKLEPLTHTDTASPFGTSYGDLSRTNINSKYMYDRRQHFYDCILQFQGKQPSEIPKEIIERLVQNYENMKSYKTKLDKAMVMKWLKENKASKYYEHVHLLYSLITGQPCHDIKHLEQQLMSDFDKLIQVYDTKFSNLGRKNFINVQYILFQLLKRHHYPCKLDDFIIIKSYDLKKFYDNITSSIFKELKWNHTSII